MTRVGHLIHSGALSPLGIDHPFFPRTPAEHYAGCFKHGLPLVHSGRGYHRRPLTVLRRTPPPLPPWVASGNSSRPVREHASTSTSLIASRPRRSWPRSSEPSSCWRRTGGEYSRARHRTGSPMV